MKKLLASLGGIVTTVAITATVVTFSQTSHVAETVPPSPNFIKVSSTVPPSPNFIQVSETIPPDLKSVAKPIYWS